MDKKKFTILRRNLLPIWTYVTLYKNFHDNVNDIFADKYTVLMAACGASGYKEEEVLKCVNILLDKRSEVNSYDR